GGRSVGPAKLAGLAVDGGDVDDAPEAPLAHALDELAGDIESAVEIDPDHGIPIGLVHLVQEAVAGDAGAVDQNLNRPDLGLDLLRHLTAGLKVGDVALYPVDVVTFALAGGLPLADLLLIRIHAGRHHPIAGGSQLSADLGANAAVAPGNQ